MGSHESSCLKQLPAMSSLHYGEWRLKSYKTATILWASTLLCAYTSTLYRMPMGLSAQVLLLSSLHLLTCLTLGAAVRGSTVWMRVFTTVLMVTRSAGYIGIGLGWIPINFKRQASLFSSGSFPLETFGYVAALLFDTIGLVHAHVPRLQLLLQTLASIISSLSVGSGIFSSVVKSCAVHGLCAVIYAILEHSDKGRYAALLEKQAQTEGGKGAQWQHTVLEEQGSSSIPAASVARAPSNTQSAKAADSSPCGAFQDAPLTRNSEPSRPPSDAILFPAEAAAVLDPNAHAATPEGRHTLPTVAANSLPSFSAPMLRSLTALPAPSKPWAAHAPSLDDLYHALQQRFVGAEGAARLQSLQSIAASTHRHRYKKQQRRHLAVMKVPGSVHPENLPASAIPSLASLINARNPEYTLEDVAMRCGCILLTMDLQEELQAKLKKEGGGPGAPFVAHKLAASAQGWLQQAQLADQLPASVPVYLQVNGTVLKMEREPATETWSVTDFSSAAPPSSQSSIMAESPAALLPTQQQQQQQQQLEQSCSEGRTLELRARVRMPAGFGLVGWDGTNSARSAQPAADSSKERSTEETLEVLANLNGSGYLRTRVDGLTVCEGGELAEVQVSVSLPADEAAITRPCSLSLELWQRHTLHSSSTLLLLPASLQNTAAELQQLPWEEEDVAEYVHDLGKWLHRHSPTCLSGQSAQLSSSPPAWETGKLLLRQAVLWGLPALSTLLVERLMALPSAPAAPFLHTAHAPTPSPAAHPPAPEELGLEDLGGLLHLALLSPASSSTLTAVLDWGRRWGAREPGFAWRWCERSRAGLSPLDILASMPRSSKTLQLVLSDPEQGRALLGAALARAYGSNGTRCSVSAPQACGLRASEAATTGSPASQQLPRVPDQAAGASASGHGLGRQAAAVTAALRAKLFSSLCAPSHAIQLAASTVACPSVDVAMLPARAASLATSLSGMRQRRAAQQQQQLSGPQQGGDGKRGGVISDSGGSSMRAKVGGHREKPADDFWVWANLQAAGIAQKWCTVHSVHLLAAILRNTWMSGCVLEANYLGLCPLALAYGLGSLALPSYPQHSEVFLAIIILARICWIFGSGTGFFPLGNSAAHFISIRAEYALEILLMSTLEQVRFSWMLPLRFLLFVGYAMMYSTYGKARPWLEAALLNLAALGVTMVMECRMRKLYEYRQKRMAAEAASCPEAQVHQQLKVD